MRWTSRLALTAIVLSSLLLARDYIAHNCDPLAELLFARWKSAPLFLLLAMTMLILFLRALRRRGTPNLGFMELGLMLWMGSVCVSAAALSSTPMFFGGAIAPYFVGGACLLVFHCTRPSLPTFRAIVATAALLAATAVILDAEHIWRRPSTLVPGGFFGNRNYAGEYLAICLPTVLMTLRRSRTRWLLPLVGIALAWTRCRTAWLASAASVAALLIATTPQHRRMLAVAGAVVLASGIAGAWLPNRLQWRTVHPQRDSLYSLLDVRSGSGHLRLREHVETAAMTLQHLVHGVGPGRWQPEIARRAPTLALNRYPHSDYLRALSDGGVPCLLGLLGIYGCAVAATWRRRSDAADVFGTVVALAGVGLADSPLYRIECAVIAFAVVTFAMERRGAAAASLTCEEDREEVEVAHAQPSGVGGRTS